MKSLPKSITNKVYKKARKLKYDHFVKWWDSWSFSEQPELSDGMTFEEIFNKKGMYVANSFMEGYCFVIDEYGSLTGVKYSDKDEIIPTVDNVPVYKGLFSKTYKEVYTRQALFETI